MTDTPESSPEKQYSFLDRVCIEFSSAVIPGRSPIASGTAGSALAAAVAPFIFMPLSITTKLIILAVLFLLGSLAASRVEKLLDKKDPGLVIMDEIIGQFIVFTPFTTLTWPQILFAFLLFRLFDITKPYPIRQSETWLPAGFGIMIDDVLAGLYALAIFWPALYLLTR